VSGSGISWAICKSASRSSQITMPAPHHSVFYRPDALPAAQPTVSKHWRQYDWIFMIEYSNYIMLACKKRQSHFTAPTAKKHMNQYTSHSLLIATVAVYNIFNIHFCWQQHSIMHCSKELYKFTWYCSMTSDPSGVILRTRKGAAREWLHDWSDCFWFSSFSALILLARWQKGHLPCEKKSLPIIRKRFRTCWGRDSKWQCRFTWKWLLKWCTRVFSINHKDAAVAVVNICSVISLLMSWLLTQTGLLLFIAPSMIHPSCQPVILSSKNRIC